MIVTLPQYRPDTRIEADLCVIGAGPAGIAVAREFLDGDLRVLVVESGGVKPRPKDQVLNKGRSVGAAFRGLEEGRVRAFGGTTWAWAGQCVAQEPEAFGPRSWVPGSGWPIGPQHLKAYSRLAADFFGISSQEDADDPWSAAGVKPPGVDERHLTVGASLFADPLSAGRAHLDAFRRSHSVTTLLEATVTRLLLTRSGRSVGEAEVSTLDGDRRRINARAFVLCCGGIENARLLLLSGDLELRLGALGGYFQDHLLARVARLQPLDRPLLHDQFALLRKGGRTRMPRLSLSANQQREHAVLACHAYVGWDPPASGPALRSLLSPSETLGGRARSLATLAGDVPELVSAAARYRRGLSSAPRRGPMWLDVRAEQAPDPWSRVTLGRDPDPLGLPEATVDWRLGDQARRTMRAMVDVVGAELRRLDLAVTEPMEWLDDPHSWSSHVTDAFHHMGTTRMSEDARTGVVDASCKVHGLANVFVAGSSVFPAAGAANPTLTLVALAIRLADHLKASMTRR